VLSAVWRFCDAFPSTVFPLVFKDESLAKLAFKIVSREDFSDSLAVTSASSAEIAASNVTLSTVRETI